MRRARLYKTPAVVLKRMDLGEADRIITFYTRDYGKLRAVAKGVRRATSRSAGHLEPFTVTDLLLAAGRELDVVSQAETITSFRQVREQVVLTTHAYYLAELTDRLTEDRMENEAVFDALIDGFVALTDQPDARLVLIDFQLRLLRILGYQPELSECVTCRNAIQPASNRFSGPAGGALCPDCGAHDGSARPITVPALKLLRYLQRTPEGPHPIVPPTVSHEAEGLLRDYSEQLIERRLTSPALIARVQQTPAPRGL